MFIGLFNHDAIKKPKSLNRFSVRKRPLEGTFYPSDDEVNNFDPNPVVVRNLTKEQATYIANEYNLR